MIIDLLALKNIYIFIRQDQQDSTEPTGVACIVTIIQTYLLHVLVLCACITGFDANSVSEEVLVSIITALHNPT